MQISPVPCVPRANHPRSPGLPSLLGKTGLVCNYLTASWRGWNSLEHGEGQALGKQSTNASSHQISPQTNLHVLLGS